MILEGIYVKTLFRNHKTGFTIFMIQSLRHDNKGNKMHICRGMIPRYAVHTPLYMEGEYQSYLQKESFIVSKIFIDVKNDRLVFAFALSQLGPGMGSVCAERFVSYLRQNKLSLESFLQQKDVLESLSSMKGFSKAKSMSFLTKMQNSFQELSLLNELASYGITFQQVNRMHQLYENQTIEQIRSKPYISMKRAKIPFNNIDAYARAQGYTFCDPDRVAELAAKSFQYLAQTGNSYGKYNYMLKIFRRMEKESSCFDEEIPESLVVLELLSNKAGYVHMPQDYPLFYNRQSWNAENKIVDNLARLQRHKKELLTEAVIQSFLIHEGCFLDATQKNAFSLFKDTGLAFLIGGPGTGKTTTIKTLVTCYKKIYPGHTISLCAPTGRAAERIKEATGFEATTIHMLLEFYMENGISYPMRNKENPIESDLIIIDEFSMVGINLFSLFLEAVTEGTKLLFVGDWNQLQSIEPGFLLHDMVDSGVFPYVILTKTHRQVKNSSIIENSQRILEGNIQLIQDTSCEIYHFQNNSDARMKLKDLYLKYYATESFQDFHVITPKRTGKIGVEEVNLLAQELFHNAEESHLSYGASNYYQNDKVMTTRNCYDTNNSYYNGDMWTVKDFLGNDKLTLASSDDSYLNLGEDNLDDLSLAYAMTIHKCQGSEGKIIVLVLPDDIPEVMITKSLLYTGATRPKEKLIILSVGGMLEHFIRSSIHQDRNSGISDKINCSELKRFPSYS